MVYPTGTSHLGSRLGILSLSMALICRLRPMPGSIAECEYLQGQRGQEQRKESSKQFAMYLHMESLLSRILSYSI